MSEELKRIARLEIEEIFSKGNLDPVDEQLAEGDTVMTRWTATGTLLGLEPTGRPITMQGVDIERFVDGQIAEVRSIWDTYAVRRQIGAVDLDIDVWPPAGSVQQAPQRGGKRVADAPLRLVERAAHERVPERRLE